MERIVCLLIGYVFGNFPTGYLYAKMHGVDITHKGSGNVGTTNVLRNMGPKAGLITMLGDFAKTFIPLIIVTCFFYKDRTDMRYLLIMYTGLGAILGHNFPLTLKLHGGKGIACTGALICYSDPRLLLACFIAFFGSVAITRYVSVGSLLVAVLFSLINIYIVSTGLHPLSAEYHMEFYIVCLVISGLAIFKHRSNIKRLLEGRENKLSFGKKKGKE